MIQLQISTNSLHALSIDETAAVRHIVFRWQLRTRFEVVTLSHWSTLREGTVGRDENSPTSSMLMTFSRAMRTPGTEFDAESLNREPYLAEPLTNMSDWIINCSLSYLAAVERNRVVEVNKGPK